MGNKVCRICGESLPATDDFFPKMKDYLRGECIECCRKISNERNACRTREQRLCTAATNRAWRKANPEKIKAIVKRSKAKSESRADEALGIVKSRQISEAMAVEEQKRLKEDEYTRQWKNCKRTVNGSVNEL